MHYDQQIPFTHYRIIVVALFLQVDRHVTDDIPKGESL